MTGDNDNELLPIVDEEGNLTGSASRGECHAGSMLLHPVVHLHLFSPDGRLFLQKRPLWKSIQPGKWDTAVGGHVALGENISSALIRETLEEIGLDASGAEELGHYIFESPVERELVFVYRLTSDTIPAPSPELDGGKFWSREEILSAIGKEILTPNFESEYLKFFPAMLSIFRPT